MEAGDANAGPGGPQVRDRPGPNTREARRSEPLMPKSLRAIERSPASVDPAPSGSATSLTKGDSLNATSPLGRARCETTAIKQRPDERPAAPRQQRLFLSMDKPIGGEPRPVKHWTNRCNASGRRPRQDSNLRPWLRKNLALSAELRGLHSLGSRQNLDASRDFVQSNRVQPCA